MFGFPSGFLFLGLVASADEKLILFLNYVLSEAKLAIYLSRKAKIKGKPPQQCNVILYFQSLVSTRLKLEFNYDSNNANILMDLLKIGVLEKCVRLMRMN